MEEVWVGGVSLILVQKRDTHLGLRQLLPRGDYLFLCLDTKEPKNQGCEAIPEIQSVYQCKTKSTTEPDFKSGSACIVFSIIKLTFGFMLDYSKIAIIH